MRVCSATTGTAGESSEINNWACSGLLATSRKQMSQAVLLRDRGDGAHAGVLAERRRRVAAPVPATPPERAAP